ncbi:MAG: choice-of-anchor D domain-containing protein [Myxococcota bacterium]
MRFDSYLLRAAPALALGALVGLAGCEDDVGIQISPPAIQIDPPSVDFGNVQVGTTGTETLFIRNTGGSVLTFDLNKGNPFVEVYEFTVDGQSNPQSISVQPDGVAAVNVTFTPDDLGRIPSVIRVATNVRDGEGNEINPEIQITGNGVTTTLEVSPDRVDFRNVVVGTTKTLPIQLTNNSEVDAEITYSNGTNIRRCDQNQNDPSTFCVRSRDFVLDDQGRFQLGANKTASLEVQFTPNVAGTRSDGNFTLKACAADVCDVRVSLTGFGVEAGLRCRPPTLDFGQINPGSSQNQSVTCENIANEQVTLVSWAITQDSDPAFEVESARPQVLNEGDTVAIEATYAPTSLGDALGTLRLETDNQNPALRNIDVTLQGTGGGPDIEVLPPSLNFGRVSLIAPSRRNIVITNTGFAPLTVSSIEVDTMGTMSFTSPDANATVLPPGESQTVTIEFTPRVVGEIQSTVRITSNDTDESILEIAVRGEGVNLPPCNFTVVPSQLNFGAVQRTRSLRRAFEIRNNGSDICLITAVRLVGGSDPAYSLPGGDIISQEIPAGAAETVTVEFAPQVAGTITGQVEFSISSPTSPFNTVDLTGVGADSTLLIVPAELNFGTIGVGCASRDRAVTVYNTGAVDVQIDSINLAQPTNPAFSVSNRPAPLPGSSLTLRPGQSTVFDVGFRADAISAYASAVEINATINSAPVTFIVPLEGRGSLDATQVDEFEQLGKPKVDVLFVIDNSCSMIDEQAALGSNFQAFVQFAEAQGLEFQLGVTTADTDTEAGRLVSANPGTTNNANVNGPPGNRIVTPQTSPSPSAVFASNVSLPTSPGSSADESGLRAAELALSSPVVFGHNAGFLRSDAVLSIIFVSDEPDQSNNLGGSVQASVDYYINFFLSIKGFRNTNLFSASAITAGNGSCNGPGGSASASGRYLAAAERTGGVFQSICTSDWSRSLEDLSTTAFGFKSRFFMTNQPVISTLKVFIDGSELAQTSSGGTVNWTYDFGTNSVNFAPYATPEPGAQIRVEYSAECL